MFFDENNKPMHFHYFAPENQEKSPFQNIEKTRGEITATMRE